MKMSTKILFMIMLVSSTIMVMSSSNWLNMWIGMEINLMSFIPMMSQMKNNMLSQSAMMYFLTQSMASMLFIMMVLMNKMIMMNMWEKNIIKYIIIISMMMKLGMPPFHMWFMYVLSKMKWNTGLLLLTWQKIAPMYVMSQIINNDNIVMMMICVSTLTGAIMGLNHTNIKKIMAYSSMNHMGWIMACMISNKKSWMMYLIMYMIIMIMMVMYLYNFNIIYINQLSMQNMSPSEKMMLIMLMLSMGGMPPFFGFMPKWMALQYMISLNEMLMIIIMLMSTMISLFYYMRMTSSFNLMMSSSQKWMMMTTKKNNMIMYMFMVNSMLPLTVILLNF